MPQTAALYQNLIKEEFTEFIWADHDSDKLKELCDLMWVCIMYGLARGWKLQGALKALVQEYKSKFYTADGKLEPLYREDGKLMKNTGFKKMDPSKYLAKWDRNE